MMNFASLVPYLPMIGAGGGDIMKLLGNRAQGSANTRALERMMGYAEDHAGSNAARALNAQGISGGAAGAGVAGARNRAADPYLAQIAQLKQATTGPGMIAGLGETLTGLSSFAMMKKQAEKARKVQQANEFEQMMKFAEMVLGKGSGGPEYDSGYGEEEYDMLLELFGG